MVFILLSGDFQRPMRIRRSGGKLVHRHQTDGLPVGLSLYGDGHIHQYTQAFGESFAGVRPAVGFQCVMGIETEEYWIHRFRENLPYRGGTYTYGEWYH